MTEGAAGWSVQPVDIQQKMFSSTSGSGRYAAATYRLQTRMGLTITVQLRGNIFTREWMEKNGTGELDSRQYAQFAKQLNDRLSLIVQEEVVRQRKAGSVGSRRSVSSGRLDWFLSHRNNRTFRPFGFGVGVGSWLERSAVKYARAIDLGSWHMVGRVFYGAFGDSVSPGASRARVNVLGPYRRAGVNRSGAWKHGASAAQAIPTRRHRPSRLVIEQPIRAQNYYARAVAALDLDRLALRAYRDLVAEVFS